MKEIGSREATKANVFCTNTYCELNDIDAPLIPGRQAITQAEEHDKIPGHEGIVVKYDGKHPLSSEDGTTALFLTGMMIG